MTLSSGGDGGAADVRKRGRKRKVKLPAAFLEAARAEFAEKGYAATRMQDVASRLGIVRSTLYRYFADKEDLFRAVVVETIAPNVVALRLFSITHSPSIAELLRALVDPMARMASELPLGGVLKTVIGEAGNFPELARIWHDQLMAPTIELLAEAISQGQQRGEVRAGDPQALAFQLISPLIMSLIWRETFVPAGAADFDIRGRLEQAVETFLAGVLTTDGRAAAGGSAAN